MPYLARGINTHVVSGRRNQHQRHIYFMYKREKVIAN